MKTISLTEEAYQRLLAQKLDHRDSFSKVVLRVVPRRGTAAHLLQEIQKLPPLTDAQARIMEETVAEHNDWKNWRDPWTAS